MARAKKIAVTGGAGQIAYSLLFRIASGEMLGSDQPIELRLLETPEGEKALAGVVMELEDCAFPLLTAIEAGTDPFALFEEVDIALLVGAKPRGPGMERKDLLQENGKIFIQQGKALNEKAARDVLVHVVGNPCNTNALITLSHAPKLDKRRFFAMTRLDQNRAQALLAKKAKVPVAHVKGTCIWGNHSSTQVPDFIHASIGSREVKEVIGDRAWLEKEFVELIQKRGAAVIAARGKSSAASAAQAIIDSIRSLMDPTPEGEWFSVGLLAEENSYGIDEGIVFSFPCCSRGNGEVEIISGFRWDPFLKEKIAHTEKELLEEKALIKELL